MAGGRFFENNVKLSYLSEKSSDFDEIWCTTADCEPDNSHMIRN